jgi:hypothetical protein
MRIAFAATLVAVVTSPLLAFAQTEPAAGAVISGRLVDAVGCPVIDVVLRIRPSSTHSETDYVEETRSDADGAFAFKPVVAGRNYWLRYDLKPTGRSGGTTVTLGPTGTHLTQLWPSPFPSELTDLDFAVTDLDDEPVRGARIAWHRLLGSIESDCGSGSATTNALGRAVEPAVAPGRYRVTVDADGFASQTIDTGHDSEQRALRVRLLTPEEARKAKKGSTVIDVCGPAPPSSVATLVATSDAIVVARIMRAQLDADYTIDTTYPQIRTLYDIQLLDTIKPHPLLGPRAGIVSIMHNAGELELEDRIVNGLEHTPMREGDVYVMFLVWHDYYQMMMPAYASAFLANITTGVVAPMRRTRQISPVIARRKGMPAAQFVQAVRSALK